MPVATGQPAKVRLANPVVEELRALPPEKAAAVARAIQSIGTADGSPLGPPDDQGRQYLVMVPGDDRAPVVIYRQLLDDEGGGYLVTGLSDRSTYDTYVRAEQSGVLDSPAAQAVLAGAAVAAAIGYALGSRSGKGSSSG